MTNTYRMNEALVVGDISDDILDRPLTIAHGVRAEDKQWANHQYTGETFLEMLSRFERGVKDGACILQGSVVDPSSMNRGVQRQAKNVKLLQIMMFDHDTGATVDEIAERITDEFCLLWTTHSHMKPFSMIAEAKVLQWMKTNKIKGDVPTDDQVLDFLNYSQKIHSKFLTTARVVERVLIEGGRKIKVEHLPMPRLRSLFFLRDPFDFATRPGSQKQAIDEWKGLYAGACVARDLPFDPACVDPSRLMYLPRIAENADRSEHEIRIIAGDFLDLSKVSPVVKTRGVSSGTAPVVTLTPFQASVRRHVEAIQAEQNGRVAAPASTVRAHKTFRTPGLSTFLKRESKFFRAADFMYATAPMDRRYDYNDGKMDFRCPNEDGHSDPNETDRGFFVTNYDSQSADASGDGSWMMRCPHTSCLGASEEDRAWYLDEFCVNEGIEDASELQEFVDREALEEYERVRKEQADAEKARQDTADAEARDDNAIVARIVALEALPADADDTKQEASETLKEILARRLMKHPEDENKVESWAGRIAKASGSTKGPYVRSIEARAVQLREVDREVVAAVVEANNPPDASQEPPFRDPSVKQTLWPGHNEEWTELIVGQGTLKQLERANREAAIPRLYLREEGGVVRVSLHRSGKLMVEEMDPARWTNEIMREVEYKKVMASGTKHIPAPMKAVEYVVGEADKDFPFLDRVVKVPVFSEAGTLLTERGYVPDMRTYLYPNFKVLPVPTKPTRHEVDAAVALLREALTDFPFTDRFDGKDNLPIKLDERDAGGHPLPNPERGKSSFANMIAMILQPFVQHMIKGNSPAFHIDKSKPGTGAGYLVDVAFCIAEGKRATVRVMSDNNEEFKKAITATLRQGTPIIFIDNINRKVDSGALAAALTTGTWSDRVLGVSENVDIEVRSVWVMAGNNLSYSAELYRRNVPIRLDSATPNPAQDRKQGFFKHFPLQDWLLEHRAELVRACHILIANWLAADRPRGTVTFNSFDHWAAVLGGILDCAGIPGFLDNIPDYLTQQNTDANEANEYVEACWRRFKDKTSFSPEEALAAATNPVGGGVLFGLPFDPTKGGDKGKRELGLYIGKHLFGQKFWVREGGDTQPAFMIGWTTNTKRKHSLFRVSPATEGDRQGG